MLKLAIKNVKGDKVKDIKLAAGVWGITPNDSVLYNSLVLAQASLRQGTHATKTRGKVRGGGRKPWRQKGTGRARIGSIRAPHWTGGGVVFGPSPRSYSKKMNKKERKLAFKSALAYKVINKEIFGMDNFELESNKTKDFLSVLNTLSIEGKSLLVVANDYKNLEMASRNLKGVEVMNVDRVGVLDVSKYNNLVIEEAAIKKLEEVLS